MKSNITNIYHIQSVSKKLRHLLTFLIILVPLLTLLYWLFFNSLPNGFKSGLPIRIRADLPLTTLLLAFLVQLLPVCAALYGAIHLRKLFCLYEKGIVFSESNVSCFRHIGYSLILLVIANFISVFLFSLVLKFASPPDTGHGQLVIQFGSSDILMLIIGIVILLISWVMKEAVTLEDEHAHTV